MSRETWQGNSPRHHNHPSPPPSFPEMRVNAMDLTRFPHKDKSRLFRLLDIRLGDLRAEHPRRPRCCTDVHDANRVSMAESGSLVHQLASSRVSAEDDDPWTTGAERGGQDECFLELLHHTDMETRHATGYAERGGHYIQPSLLRV